MDGDKAVSGWTVTASGTVDHLTQSRLHERRLLIERSCRIVEQWCPGKDRRYTYKPMSYIARPGIPHTYSYTRGHCVAVKRYASVWPVMSDASLLTDVVRSVDEVHYQGHSSTFKLALRPDLHLTHRL
jgi:hypothetical protein